MYRYSIGRHKIAFYGVQFAIASGGHKYPNIRGIGPENILQKKL